MKKIHKIMIAALSICMVASLSAAPVFANVKVETNDDGSVAWVEVYDSPDSGDDNSYTLNGDVNGASDEGMSVSANAIAYNSADGEATATINGNVNTSSEAESLELTGVTAYSSVSGPEIPDPSSEVPDQVTASSEVNVTGSITVGSEQYEGNTTGIKARAEADDSNEVPGQQFIATSTINSENDLTVLSSGDAVGVDVSMSSDNDANTVETSVKVGGSVEVSAGNQAAGIRIDPDGDGLDGHTSTSIDVNGYVNAVSHGEGGCARGILIQDIMEDMSIKPVKDILATIWIDGKVNVDGGNIGSSEGIYLMVDQKSVIDINISEYVRATGINSDGIYIQSLGGSNVNINVGDDLYGDANGAVISADGDSDVCLSVKNDLTGGDAGLVVLCSDEASHNTIDVVVEHTLSGGEHTIVIVNPIRQNYPNVYVWKAKVNNDGHIVYVEGNDGNSEDIEINNIYYILKVEQPTNGGTLSLSDENGNELKNMYGYYVSKVGGEVLLKVNVNNGYQIIGAYNGSQKLNLYRDNNVYYLRVPKGGGVYLTAILEKILESTPASKPIPTPVPDEKNQEEPIQPVASVWQQNIETWSLGVQGTTILEKKDSKTGVSISFYSDGAVVLKDRNGKKITGTYSVQNGMIEVKLGDLPASKIDKDGTLVLNINRLYGESITPYDTLQLKFSSDDLTVLLSNLTNNSVPVAIEDSSSRTIINLYKNGIYKVMYQDPDTRDTEYGTFRFEIRNGKEEIIFTNVKGEEMIIGDENVLSYMPMKSGSGQSSEETFEFQLDRSFLTTYR